LVFVVIIQLLYAFSDGAVLGLIFKLAGYTYGPLLGLFAFGLFTKLSLHDRYVPIVCISAPILTYIIEMSSKQYFDVGFLTILVNGFLTFVGLWVISYREVAKG